MKRILRHFLISILSLYLATQLASGLVFKKGIETFLLAGVSLAAVSLLAKPVINLLLLPLNLISFGLFRWVSSAVALYIVTLVVPGFEILGFKYPGLSTQWLDIPRLDFSGVVAFIAFSFVLSVITSFLHWIRK